MTATAMAKHAIKSIGDGNGDDGACHSNGNDNGNGRGNNRDNGSGDVGRRESEGRRKATTGDVEPSCTLTECAGRLRGCCCCGWRLTLAARTVTVEVVKDDGNGGGEWRRNGGCEEKEHMAAQA